MPFPLFFLLPFVLFPQNASEKYPPEGFVYVHEMVPNVQYEIRYCGSNNFTGKPIPGYENATALLTSEAAAALQKVSQNLNEKGFLLKIFDAYRPQQAVDSFVEWARNPADTLTKRKFYPEIDKKNLFSLNYIASRSGHSRGSTIDLTLLDKSTGKELDMGSPYDFFGPVSHHGSPEISAKQQKNRLLLKNAMEAAGFRALQEEWWHYSLRNEPYPETYFDFPVK
ncbi:M15 family metallopeptidase [Salinimicrobium sp. GXAS 041]|uniref:M15 family metallopeptidase n=1 Tax=Salinimicrobium sp. GXAS 041 TaxID=3400806 RepID=UPI003C748FE2